ncbi:hypothetical protein O181_112231 [Austropuccinia psidii MF-1]|uniref:Uncharacterized protein n=1 Tax=Austropuccinia psidii MF-1 TaxID=1389203 RepID=A0A9Q3K2M8_9BASI|nr:hypothetical protein [Austropuccinia psidii MF-1]
MAPGTHQRPQDHLSSIFTLTLRGILQFLHAPHTQGCRSGAYMVLYTIMHHFFSAIQWCHFQDPIPSFQIKVSKSNAHFEGGFLSSSVWQSMAAIRRPFKDPNHVALQELGWKFIQDYSKGHSQRLYIISISSQGIKYFNTPWTTQLVYTGGSQSTSMYLAQLGQFIFHCGNSITRFKFQDGKICIDPIQTIQPVTHLPGSVFQLFTYTGHLSAPGDFFPVN